MLNFAAPPLLLNAEGRRRKVGFELEFGGVGLDAAASSVMFVFGGTSRAEHEYSREVETRHGAFRIEVDSHLLKDKKCERLLKRAGIEGNSPTEKLVERSLFNVLSFMAPFEVVTPPLQLGDLYLVDRLRDDLRNRGARGTRYSLRYAFGLHINAEAPSLEPGDLRNHMRAFVLLYPWLKKRVEVDVTRKMSPYIASFSSEFAEALFQNMPASEFPRLYLMFNDSRNRPLDLLPILLYRDESLVRAFVDDERVDARPAFHYRLPNCLVDEPTWSIAREWNTWVEVERLANDEKRLSEMMDAYARISQNIWPFQASWSEHVERYVG